MIIDRLGKFAADTRNPAIANAMEIRVETENRYSGIPTIISAMEEYGLPEPVFESDRGGFKVTLYNRSFSSSVSDPVSEEILSFCRTVYNQRNRFRCRICTITSCIFRT